VAVYCLAGEISRSSTCVSVSRNIEFASTDRMHTLYIFPARVVERTNPTMSPPTDGLRPREQDHRDQRSEGHIKGQGRSWASPRGRFTLQLSLPAHLASRLDSRLESVGLPCSHLCLASPRHASPHLTLPRDSRVRRVTLQRSSPRPLWPGRYRASWSPVALIECPGASVATSLSARSHPSKRL
jgi:hypothetical protein